MTETDRGEVEVERKCVIMVVVERSGRGGGGGGGGKERGGGRECVCNVMRERTEQEVVGAGREERA